MSPPSVGEPPALGLSLPFSEQLTGRGLELRRDRARTLQVNVGLLCNQSCRHCHLSAGPRRPELLAADTAEEVIAYARRGRFEVVDLTGGAPELNPCLGRLLEGLTPLVERVLLRSNLTVLATPARAGLLDLCKRLKVTLVASLPSTHAGQTDGQRGAGVWEQSIAALRLLNRHGYGQPGTGLELDLASSPAGAFLPTGLEAAEKKFRRDLEGRWGIVFRHLFAFANTPLGRFRDWLAASGNLEPYLALLTRNFNPCTLGGLMCRTLVSVSWDGFLYDCDFNQAAGLPLGTRRTHVSEADGPPPPGAPIATGEHCYACTAGAGFT